ncbi:hypothetical protein [Thermodesulfovibrio hydrogeniphilus]
MPGQKEKVMVVYYSLGNRKYWLGTIDRLIKISEILAKKGYLLQNVVPVAETYNDWIILDENYVRKVSEILEEITEQIEDDEILNDLLILKEVYNGGSVVFG